MITRKERQPSRVEATEEHPAGVRMGQASKELGIAPQLMRNWLKTGVLRAFKIGNVTYVYSSDVERMSNTPMSQLGSLVGELAKMQRKPRPPKEWPLDRR